jgi:hypothetical protein
VVPAKQIKTGKSTPVTIEPGKTSALSSAIWLKGAGCTTSEAAIRHKR